MFEMIQMPLAPLAITGWHWLFILPISVLSVFLTLLILVQRGRGGGLTGALGGMGGQSAFGAKAGDLFTKITVVVAMIWILLSMGAIRALHVDKLSNNRTQKKAVADDKKGGETTDGATDSIDPAAPLAPAAKGTAPAAIDDPPSTPEGGAASSTPAPSAPAPTPPAPANPAPETTPKTADE